MPNQTATWQPPFMAFFRNRDSVDAGIECPFTKARAHRRALMERRWERLQQHVSSGAPSSHTLSAETPASPPADSPGIFSPVRNVFSTLYKQTPMIIEHMKGILEGIRKLMPYLRAILELLTQLNQILMLSRQVRALTFAQEYLLEGSVGTQALRRLTAE